MTESTEDKIKQFTDYLEDLTTEHPGICRKEGGIAKMVDHGVYGGRWFFKCRECIPPDIKEQIELFSKILFE